jgi:hypothetical protein
MATKHELNIKTKEFCMSFKVGDKIRVIQDCSYFCVGEYDGALGMIGVIVQVSKNYRVQLNNGKTWIFEPHTLELVDGDQRSSVHAPVISVCPRCSGELYNKETVDFGTIKKCRSCGWC